MIEGLKELVSDGFEQFGEQAVIGGRRVTVIEENKGSYPTILVCAEKPSIGACVDFQGSRSRVYAVYPQRNPPMFKIEVRSD